MKQGFVKVAAATPDIRVADVRYTERGKTGIAADCGIYGR